MRLSPSIILLAGLTAACADPVPFIDLGTRPTIDKARPLVKTGTFSVCYSDATPPGEVQRLAEEECNSHGLQTLLDRDTRWQCRATSPHAAVYRCIDPEMRAASGDYINPFDRGAVTRWERDHGKRARFRPENTGPQVVLPPAPTPEITGAPAAPPPAPVPSTVLTPADIAGKPTVPQTPLKVEPAPPPPPPLPTDNGFTVPQDSWGDHFAE